MVRLAAAAALAAVVTVGSALAAAPPEGAKGPVVPERFKATTTAMTPDGVGIRVDIREWSDDAGRAAVVEAIEAGGDVSKALAGLPSVGYVWQDGSGVGYTVKYAQRTATPDGERVTFVTDKPLGSYDFKPWAPAAPVAAKDIGYSVIELNLRSNGAGDGTLSLAADVALDAASGSVSLAEGAPRLLKDAKQMEQTLWPDNG